MGARTPRQEPRESVGLNLTEKLFLGIDSAAGSMNIAFAIRMEGNVGVESARRALHAVVCAHPRLRAAVEPTLLGHRLRILPPGPRVDALVARAFEVATDVAVDDESVTRAMEALVNTPFESPLALRFRARFVAHPKQPVLILAVDHLLGDGRSVLGWLRTFHRAVNGESLAPVPLGPPSYFAALYARAPGGWAGAMRRSLAAACRRRPPSRRPAHRLRRSARFELTPVDVVPLRLRTPMRDLLRAARSRGTTLTALLSVAVSEAIARGDADAEAFRVRVAVDVRELMPDAPADGNYVTSFYARFDRGELPAMVAEAHREIREGVEAIASGERLLAGIVAELPMALGQRALGLGVQTAVALDRVTGETFQLSNLGRCEGFDRGPVEVATLLTAFRSCELFVIASGMRDHAMLSLSCPRSVLGPERLRALRDAVDDVVAELAASAADAPHSADERPA